jgi:hypothetical protein
MPEAAFNARGVALATDEGVPTIWARRWSLFLEAVKDFLAERGLGTVVFGVALAGMVFNVAGAVILGVPGLGVFGLDLLDLGVLSL